MYHSLKRQKRMRVPGQRRTLAVAPIKSGRGESTIASSEEGELNAIANAMKFGRPVYFIRNGCGSTLDVCLEKQHALRVRDEMRNRVHNGRANINAYERMANLLVRL